MHSGEGNLKLKNPHREDRFSDSVLHRLIVMADCDRWIFLPLD
jgi:hypothetical protein